MHCGLRCHFFRVSLSPTTCGEQPTPCSRCPHLPPAKLTRTSVPQCELTCTPSGLLAPPFPACSALCTPPSLSGAQRCCVFTLTSHLARGASRFGSAPWRLCRCPSLPLPSFLFALSPPLPLVYCPLPLLGPLCVVLCTPSLPAHILFLCCSPLPPPLLSVFGGHQGSYFPHSDFVAARDNFMKATELRVHAA